VWGGGGGYEAVELKGQAARKIICKIQGRGRPITFSLKIKEINFFEVLLSTSKAMCYHNPEDHISNSLLNTTFNLHFHMYEG
jgi:hypothetical protein